MKKIDTLLMTLEALVVVGLTATVFFAPVGCDVETHAQAQAAEALPKVQPRATIERVGGCVWYTVYEVTVDRVKYIVISSGSGVAITKHANQ